MTTIPATIRTIRDAQGMNTRQFGEALGVSHSAVAQWERGENEPSDERLAVWFWSSDALQVQVATEIYVVRYRRVLAQGQPSVANGGD